MPARRVASAADKDTLSNDNTYDKYGISSGGSPTVQSVGDMTGHEYWLRFLAPE